MKHAKHTPGPWTVGYKMLKLKIGQLVVYPGHGVGRVYKIEKRTLLGEVHEFASFEILETGMKLMVPTANLSQVGVRKLATMGTK